MNGEDEFRVYDGEIELEGSEIDGDEMKIRIPWLRRECHHRCCGSGGTDEGGGPAPFYSSSTSFFAHWSEKILNTDWGKNGEEKKSS